MLRLMLVAGVFIFTGMVYRNLPERIPMHWNIRGEIDSYSGRQFGAWMMPGLILLMWGMFQVLPKFDPKKENYRKFELEWQAIQTAILVLFGYLQTVILYAAMKPGASVMPLISAGLGWLFIILGAIMPGIKQNYFVGIKIPWTLANKTNWEKTHKFSRWCFWLVGAVFLGQAAWPQMWPGLMFGGMMVGVLLPIAYSGWLYTKQSKN